MRTLRSFRRVVLLVLVAAAPLWARPRAAPGFPLQGLLPGASAPGSAVSGNLRMDALSPFLTHSGLFLAVAAALATGWIAALSSALAQGGLVFAPTSLLPSAARTSPAAKLKQLFSISALQGLIKSLLPAAAVGYLAVGCLRRDWPLLMALPARSPRAMLGFAGSRVFEVAWKSALVLVVWAVLDYLFERQHFSTELRMSCQELVDEYKETEGNPVIKGRKMLEDTKRAAVVITNPTGYAVALEYRPDLPAPVVVAKGRNLLASQIKEIARWGNIPLVENKQLAHVLYRTVEVGQSIPANLYAVIAEILAAVSRAEARALAAASAARGGHRRILDGLRQLAGDQVAQTAPILFCSTPARFHLRRLLEPFLPKVVVLSPLEIPPMVSVQSLGVVR